MSTSNSNKLFKSKRERGNSKAEQTSKKNQNTKLKSSKKSSKKGKIEKDNIKSIDGDLDEENQEENKQENSLGQLTRNFLQYIKNKGRVNININDLVNDLRVMKRRIYDITNVLQGIGYIEKKGKNEISWTKNNKDQYQNNSNLSDNYTSNINKLKLEFEDLKKEDKENEDKLNKYREEFSLLSGRKDFHKYGYITFNDIKNLSKDDNLDFIIIKASKGTVINVIDDEESKKAYTKIKNQMESGKIQKNEKLLTTLENLHHIFLYSKNEKLKIYKVQNGEIGETIKNRQISGEIKINNSLISNDNSFNFNEEKNLTNKKNNIIFKDKETIGKNDNILNINKNLNKSNNIFSFEENIKLNTNLFSSNINETSNNIQNYNNSMSTNKNTNSKHIFTFGNEQQNSNNNSDNFLYGFNLNKNTNNDELKEKKINNLGISGIFK